MIYDSRDWLLLGLVQPDPETCSFLGLILLRFGAWVNILDQDQRLVELLIVLAMDQINLAPLITQDRVQVDVLVCMVGEELLAQQIFQEHP